MRAETRHGSRRRLWATVAGIYILALVIRLGFLSEARHNPLYQFLVLDERTQHEVGVAISKGALPPNGYFKAPLYGYFLGAIYRIGGDDPLVARTVQGFLSALAPVLVVLIARRLVGEAAGLPAGVLASLYWISVFFSTELLDVTLASVFYLLLAWMLVTVEDARGWKWACSGVLLGLGAITRPNILAFAPVLAILIAVAVRRGSLGNGSAGPSSPWARTALKRIGLLGAGLALAVAPVTLRNMIVANERLLICAYGGINAFIANNTQSDGKNAICPKLDITVRHPGLDMNDPAVRWDEGWQACYLYAAQHLGPRPRYDQVERFFYRATLDYIRHHPGKFITDTLKRFCWMFNAYEYPNNKDKYRFCKSSRLLWTLSWLHFGIIGPIGIVGTVMAVRRRPWPQGFAYYLAMILSLALPGTLFVVNSRYRLPIVYLLMPMVVHGIMELCRLFKPPVMWRRNAIVGGGLAGLFVISNLNLFGYRPPYHEYLLFSLAGACGATGRSDLMAETVNEIEKALADESHRQTLHPWAMTCLFGYFRDRGELTKAADYGWKMLHSEPVDVQTIGSLVDVLARSNRRDQARTAIQVLAARSKGEANPCWASALLTYGRVFNDETALKEAVRQFEILVRLQPENIGLMKMLVSAKERMGGVRSEVGTTKTTTTSCKS